MSGRGATERNAPLGRRDGGQALTVFALVRPIVLFRIVGMADFARAWHTVHAMADAAREGLRLVVVANGEGPTEARTLIIDRLASSGIVVAETDIEFETVLSDGTTVELTGEPERSDPVTIRLRHDFSYLVIGALLEWASSDREFVTTYTMRAE